MGSLHQGDRSVVSIHAFSSVIGTLALFIKEFIQQSLVPGNDCALHRKILSIMNIGGLLQGESAVCQSMRKNCSFQLKIVYE
jgi:hypothetical protein